MIITVSHTQNIRQYKYIRICMLHISSREISCLSEFIMEQIQLLMVFICLLGNKISAANKILYVLPNDSTNTSCTYQPCTTLSKYLLDDGTLPDVTNVEYHFLPGEHQIPANTRMIKKFKI